MKFWGSDNSSIITHVRGLGCIEKSLYKDWYTRPVAPIQAGVLVIQDFVNVKFVKLVIAYKLLVWPLSPSGTQPEYELISFTNDIMSSKTCTSFHVLGR